jgi:signal transduction histidine kinase
MICTRIITYVILFLNISLSARSLANNCLDVSENLSPPQVSDELSYFTTSDSSLLPQYAKLQFLNDSKPIFGDFPSFGYSSQDFWFSLCLTNPSKLPLERTLRVDFAHIDEVDLFFQSPPFSSWTKIEEGRMRSALNPSLALFPTFQLTVLPDEQKELYFRVRSADNIMFPLSVINSETHKAQLRWEDVSFALYFGFVGCLTLMALGLFFASRHSMYIYQSITLVSMHILSMFFLRGQGFSFWRLPSPIYERWLALSFSVLGTGFFLFLFREVLFDVENSKSRRRIFKSAALLMFAALPLLWFCPFSVAALLSQGIIFCAGVLMFLHLKAFSNGFEKEGAIFGIGFVILFACYSFFVGQDFGLWAGPSVADKPMMIGFSLHAVMLSSTLFSQLHSIIAKQRLASFDLQTQLSEMQIRLSYVAHEIRNPLAVAMSWLGIMDQSPEMGRRSREKIQRSLTQINSLVSDLYDAQKASTSKLELHFEKSDVNLFFEEVLQDYRSLAQQNNVQLTLKLLPTSWSMEVDSLRLHQVLNNLITNSLKFTPPNGEIRVDLFVTANQFLKIEVTDTGRGMSESFARQATQRFAQERVFDKGNNDTKVPFLNGKPGLGLGLFLARRIVESHGGTLQIESKGIGQGTKVTLLLPLAHQQGDEKPSHVLETRIG